MGVEQDGDGRVAFAMPCLTPEREDLATLRRALVAAQDDLAVLSHEVSLAQARAEQRVIVER